MKRLFISKKCGSLLLGVLLVLFSLNAWAGTTPPVEFLNLPISIFQPSGIETPTGVSINTLINHLKGGVITKWKKLDTNQWVLTNKDRLCEERTTILSGVEQARQ